MTDRDRLIKLLNEAFIKSDDNYGMPNTNQVTDYLVANGVVVLPCNVFDDVYLIHNGAIEKCVVEGIHYTKKSSYVRLRPYHQDYLGNWSKYFTPSIHSFVKTIFPTREEAEKALKERNVQI